MMMTEPPKTENAGILTSLEPFLEPFFEYGRSLRVWIDPGQLALRIRENEITTGDLSKFLGASAVIGLVISRILPGEGELVLFHTPLVDEGLYAIIILAAGVSLALPIFWPLRWLGGKGSLRHTLIGAAYASGAFFPFNVFSDGLAWQLFHRNISATTYFIATFFYYCYLFAGIHQISGFRVGLALVTSLIGGAAVVFVGLILIGPH
jgi:hypothetical protein